MLNEQQLSRLIYRLVDPTLEVTLEETEGIIAIQVLPPDKAFIHLALADPEYQTEAFTKNLKEMVGEFGFQHIELELSYLPQEVIDRIEHLHDNILSENKETTFIAIASGKGGVGKSTVAANLAVALAKQGQNVGLLDADIYGFSIPFLLGLTEPPQKAGGRIIPASAHGIKTISMDYFIGQDEPVIWRGPMLGKMIKMFLEEVDWGDLDYLLIDLPPGTGDVALDMHALLPSCHEIIVTTPHQAAAQVALRAGYMARKNGHPLLGVIENMAYLPIHGERLEIFGTGGGRTVADKLAIPLIAQLEIAQPNQNAPHFVDAIYQDDEPLGKAYRKLAENLTERFSV
ncbi:Mrp/NBP35 family ATP-binding protein [Listeria costaricensis]|uniref:Mrp/NBP35 family ATP-binding protein n=1 Tax=Listeria costaricensis TaxID=2026604 RepID=UPI000C06FBCE|nr:Mrp/NBP35 family ATP-binding protein [Listeria costaricensis]